MADRPDFHTGFWHNLGPTANDRLTDIWENAPLPGETVKVTVGPMTHPHMDPGVRDSSRHDLQAKQPRWCGVLGQARSSVSLVQRCIQNTCRSGSHLT